MEAVLRHEGYKLAATDDELYAFIISIASGEKTFEAIEEWLKENSVDINK